MILGVIADDFTGASDVAAMLARGGMQTELAIGVPQNIVQSDADAVVIALKSRSIAADEAVKQSMAALAALRAGGARQIVFKYCSTFDSTPDGNIGPVAEALAHELGVKGVVVCPAFPENGRAVYDGHLFVKGRLLSESGLQNHPLNPMSDPDIRRWLHRQTLGQVGLVNFDTVRQGAQAIADALGVADETLVIVDAVSNDDLLAIGYAVREAPLITGAAGVAMGLPNNFREQGLLAHAPSRFKGSDGWGVVICGSCSEATRQQINSYKLGHPSQRIDVDELMNGSDSLTAMVEFAVSHPGTLFYSSEDPGDVAASQKRFGREPLAATLEAFFGRLAVSLRAAGAERMIIAGGETSGAVVGALAVGTFALGPEIAVGVPALSALEGPPLAIALKSGNFGQVDFFSRALTVLQSHV